MNYSALVAHVHESLLLDELRVHVVELRDTERGRLGHVGVRVLEARAEGLGEVLHDLLDTDHAHRADGEGADEGVGVRGILR